MIGGEFPCVPDVEGDAQRILITQGIAGIEIEPREQHVVTLSGGRIDSQVHDGVAGIGLHEDSAMLLPASCLLYALGVARPRQNLAAGDREDQ